MINIQRRSCLENRLCIVNCCTWRTRDFSFVFLHSCLLRHYHFSHLLCALAAPSILCHPFYHLSCCALRGLSILLFSAWAPMRSWRTTMPSMQLPLPLFTSLTKLFPMSASSQIPFCFLFPFTLLTTKNTYFLTLEITQITCLTVNLEKLDLKLNNLTSLEVLFPFFFIKKMISIFKSIIIGFCDWFVVHTATPGIEIMC